MRYSIYILTFLFTTTAFGQTKDRRAELDIRGRINEISVSPDEKIWLVTAIGNTYYTDNIDSTWHYGKPIFKSSDQFGLDNPNLERISFFNKDTAIMTGYISISKRDAINNGYYLTRNAGRTWKLLDFGGDSWIYAIYTDKQGNAWMGGLSKELYYSNDYGKSWKTLALAYKESDRTYGIYMTDSQNGIASSDYNEILITTNNWKTSRSIPTPLDQNKYQKEETGYSDERISKIQLWNNYIVLNQHGRVYYSDMTNIDWKPFPIKVYDFEVDNNSKKLFSISDSLKIVSFTSPTEFHLLTDKRLSSYPIDIKAVNGSLFVLASGSDVYKVNENGLTRAILYTTDKKITEPQIVKQGTKLIWGINGNQIYLADDNKRKWYRENVLDFNITDFKLLNDSVAILWDGKKNNYTYSLIDHKAKQYFPETPLETFLASPIKAFILNSGSQGCFHGYNNEIRYERVNDSIFETTTTSTNSSREKKSSNFQNKISNSSLTKILTDISSNPSAVPSFKDFQITDADKKEYLTMVDDKIKSKETDYLGRKKKINKDFYYSVPAMLDTLNNSVIATILNQQEGWTSTTSNWFTIQTINQNNDTLNIVREYYVKTLPWNLPWKFEYKGEHFNCYNIEFSRLIHSCIPDDFTDKRVFSNSCLIMEVADYLWNKED